MAALAQSATGQTWSTSITYYTPDANGGTLQIHYYPEGSGTPIDANPITLAGHAAGSLFIGSVPGMTPTFGGSAVLEANVPIVATAVNIAGESSSYPRPLYSGFDSGQASLNFYIPSVLYQAFGQTSLLSIQNVESSAISATLRVYAVGAIDPSFEATYSIPGQSAQLVPAADMGLPSGFSGSAAVSATGRVVAAAQETDDAGRGAKAFEGVAAELGASQIYMASMMCKSGSAQQISYYAIQNVGTVSANVTVKAYDTAGALVGQTAAAVPIAAGAKASLNPCDNFGVAVGKLGSAVIESDGAPIIAIGKIQSTVNGMSTAFVGAAAGSTSVAAPYVRWVADPTKDFRAYIAIMNVGDADATNIQVKYYDGNGNVAATQNLTASGSLAPFVKRNTDAATAGALNPTYGDFGFHPAGGAIEVTSDQPVVVVVRLQRNVSLGAVTLIAEDYNGTAIAP
jgi:hypothetical protein